MNLTDFMFKSRDNINRRNDSKKKEKGYLGVFVGVCGGALYGSSLPSTSRATVAALCSAFLLLLALHREEKWKKLKLQYCWPYIEDTRRQRG